jgi:hypothetical protein
MKQIKCQIQMEESIKGTEPNIKMDKYQVLILRLFRNGVLQSEESD